MLVLNRKENESINIGSDIKVRVLKMRGNRVTIGIEAPEHVTILRGELGDWSEHYFDECLLSSTQTLSQLTLS